MSEMLVKHVIRLASLVVAVGPTFYRILHCQAVGRRYHSACADL